MMQEYLLSIQEFIVQIPNNIDVQKLLYGSILNEQYDQLILKHKNLNKDICKAIIYGHTLNNTDQALNIFHAFILFYIGSEVKIEEIVDEFNDSPWDTYFNMCLYFFEEKQIKKELQEEKFNQILQLSKKTYLAYDQKHTQIKFQNIRTSTQIIDKLIELFKINRTVMDRNKKKHFEESYKFLQKNNMIKEIKDKTKLLKIEIIVIAFVAQDNEFLKNKKIQDQDKHSVLQILFEYILRDYKQLSIFLLRCNEGEKNKFIQKIQQIQDWKDLEKLVQVGRSLKKRLEWDRTIDLYEYLISQAQQFDNSFYNVYLYFTICKIQFKKGQLKKALQICNLALDQIIDYSKQKKYFYQSNKQKFIQLELLFLKLVILYIHRDNNSITEIQKYITIINQKNQIMIITKQLRSLNLIIQIFIKEILINDKPKIPYSGESYNEITKFFGIIIENIKNIQDDKNDDIKSKTESYNKIIKIFGNNIQIDNIKLKAKCILELFIMTQFVRTQKYHLLDYLNRDYLNLFLNIIKLKGLAIEKFIQDQVFNKALKNKDQNEEYPQIDDQIIKQIQNNSDFKFRDDILAFYKKVKNELAPYLTNLFPQIEKFLYFSTRYQVESQQLIDGMKEIGQFGNVKRVIYQDQEYACKISIIKYKSNDQYFSKQQTVQLDQLEKLYSTINEINTLSEIEDYKIPYVIQIKHVCVEIQKLNDETSIKIFSLSPIYQQFSDILPQSDEIKLKFVEKIAICLKQLQIKRISNYNLNPDSLLVDQNYDPVLITNGSQISDLIAKQNESSILAQINVDPEIQNQINRKNDVYSIGAILYYLFVCRRHILDVMNQCNKIEFLSLRVLEEEISKIQISEIQSLINNCTRQNLDNRYTMSQLLYQFLKINPCKYDIQNLLVVFMVDFPDIDITDQEYKLIKEFQKISLLFSSMDLQQVYQVEQIYEQLYRCQYLDKSVELQNQKNQLVFHKYQIIIKNKQLAFRQTLQCMRFVRNLIHLNNKQVKNVTKFYNFDIQVNEQEKSITFYIFCIDQQYQMDYLKYPQQLINLLKSFKEINKDGINVMALDQKFLYKQNKNDDPVLFNFLYSQRVQDDISKNQYGWQQEIDNNQQALINNDVDLIKVYFKNIVNQVNQENDNMELKRMIQQFIDDGIQFSTFKSMLNHVIPNKIEIKQNTTIYSDRSDINQFCQIVYQIFVPQDPELQDIVQQFIISMKRYKKESSELNSGIIQKKTIGKGNYGKVKKVNFQGHDYAQKISTISYESDKQNQEQIELLKSRLNEINIITQIEDYEIPYVLKNIHIGFKFKQESNISRIKIFSLSQIYKPFSVIQNLNNLKQKIQFAERIAIGLMQLQTMDISHQDIKPDNLLVDDQGNPVVIDFGISIFNFQTQPTNKHLYTLVYAAPELISNKGYSRKNDVYSFGITIYELFTCSKPIYSEEFLQNPTHIENIQKIQNYQIQQLIQKCVQPSKESRFSLCQILYQFLTINLYRKDFGTLMKLFMEKFDDVAITKQEYELIKEFQNISVKIPQMDRKEIKLTEKISENFNRCQYYDHTLYFYQYQIEIKYKQLAFRQILQCIRYARNLLNPHKKNSIKNRQFYNYSLILEEEDQELSILFEIYFHDCNYQKEYQVIQQVIKIIPLDQVLIKISILFLSIFKDFIAKLSGKLKLLNKTLRQINHCILQKFYFQFQLMRLQKNLKVQ